MAYIELASTEPLSIETQEWTRSPSHFQFDSVKRGNHLTESSSTEASAAWLTAWKFEPTSKDGLSCLNW